MVLQLMVTFANKSFDNRYYFLSWFLTEASIYESITSMHDEQDYSMLDYSMAPFMGCVLNFCLAVEPQLAPFARQTVGRQLPLYVQCAVYTLLTSRHDEL